MPARALAPERFWNLPNTITVLRIAVVPALLFFPFYHGPQGSLVAGWLFVVAALSDLVDGWLARRGQQVTRTGVLLDPLADKLLVCTALIVLVGAGRIPAWAVWMVVVIVGRELLVTGLRGLASVEGRLMAAGGPGKVKTLCQNVAIGALLFPDPTLGLPAHAMGLTLLTLATALTLWSGYIYLRAYMEVQAPAAGAAGLPRAGGAPRDERETREEREAREAQAGKEGRA